MLTLKKSLNKKERNDLKKVLNGQMPIKDYIDQTGIWLPGCGETWEEYCKRKLNDAKRKLSDN